MKKISCILIIALASVLPAQLFSQDSTKDLPALPADPRAKSGKLSNGLSYIIIKNQAQKSTATFCVAQKVGTSLEKGADRGSFMLLQQLATKGTRNFEGSAITDYLKTLGLGTDNMVFSTEADRITYMIKDVPIGRTNTIDSSLLILYNWMSSINVDESDISPERSTLAQRILGGWTPLHRMETALLGELYPDSPYHGEMRPEEIRSVNSINSKDLRSFYYNWCRPELQCVIVVGDVDPAKLETQIKSVFSTIPKPLKSTKRVWYEPKPFSGVKTFVMQDDEFEKCVVSIDLLKQPLKEKYRATNLPYIQDFMDDAIIHLLQGRIDEGILRENLPLYNLSINKGKFMGLEKSSSLSVSFETLPSSVYAAVSFISGQIKKLADYGVDSREFAKASDVYWKGLEAFYDNRSSASNQVYLDRALRAYYDGYSLASTEMQFEIMKEVLFSLNNKKLSEYASATLAQDSNIVISCFIPKAAGVNQISRDRLLAAYSQPLDKPLKEGESSLPVWPNVVPALTSTVVSDTEDALYGTRTIVLSNGATLVFKDLPSSSDSLFFRAVSKGGFSLIRGASLGNHEYFNGLLNVGKIADVSYANMSRLYAFNHLSLSSRIDQNTEQMQGFAIPSSAEKLMQAVYLNMTDRRQDPSAYELYTKKVMYDLQYNRLSPNTVFRDSVDYYRNSNKKFVRRITEDEVASYSYDNTHKTLMERFSNAADFVFFFAGKNSSAFRDLAIKYIGGIPGNPAKKENWIVVPNYLAKGHTEKRFLVKMNVPRSYAGLTLSCAKGLSSKNLVLSEMMENFVSSVIKTKLYTNVPLYNVKSALEYYPEQIYTLDLVFETDSASVHSCIESLVGELQQCSRGVLPDMEFSQLKRQLKDRYNTVSSAPEFWLDILQTKQMSGKDLSTIGSAVDAVTKKDFCDFVKDVLSANRITVIMDGTTADIPTLQLLRENEFIKNFFDVD